MVRLRLKFCNTTAGAQLVATAFQRSPSARPLITVRGRTQIPNNLQGSFHWSAGVVALSATIVKAKLALFHDDWKESWMARAGISSSTTKLATSLDYSLSKSPNWLLDMFGYDGNGIALSKRVFLRINSEQKRPGPVQVALNPSFLAPSNVKVELDGIEISSAQDLAKLLIALGHPRVMQPQAALESQEIEQRTLLQIPRVTPAKLELDLLAKKIGDLQENLISLIEIRVAQSFRQFVDSATSGAGNDGQLFVALPRGVVVVRTKIDPKDQSVLNLVLKEKGKHLELLLTRQIEQPDCFHNVCVYGSSQLKRVADFLADDIALFLSQMRVQLRNDMNNAIESFNPTVVEHLYRVVRGYLSGMSVEDSALRKFSIYAHINGRARYLIDPIRAKEVSSTIASSGGCEISNKYVPFGHTLRTEAWYATSVSRSQDTMSYTDAITPQRAWCGTPDIWRRPIPGFGASEIAVYGLGRSWAEPIGLTSKGSNVQLCAVFCDEHRSALGGKFLDVPKVLRTVCMPAIEELQELPIGECDRFCYEDSEESS